MYWHFYFLQIILSKPEFKWGGNLFHFLKKAMTVNLYYCDCNIVMFLSKTLDYSRDHQTFLSESN
jgi:hypothetical protein